MSYKEKNKWRATVMVKRKRYTSLHETKQAAKDWEAAERKRLKSGVVTPADMELLTFCNLYLDYAKKRMCEKVYQEKVSIVQRVCDAFGKHTLVDEIGVDMVSNYLLQQAEKRSNNAHNKERKNMLAQWNWAVKRKLVKHNPVAEIDRLPHDKQKQYTPPEKDVDKVLKVANQEERVFLDAYLHTAARRSEIFRWKWADDIDFEHRQVRLGTRKTKDGSMEYEWLPMTDDLYNSLVWLWDNREFPESEHVFVDTNPGPHCGEPFKVRRRFLAGLCDRAKVKSFGFHALRRHVASKLADKHGVSSKTIQMVLRHKNLSTTEKYLDNVHHDLRATMNLLNGNSFLHECVKNEQEAVLHGST